jgi:hypothetical protein
MFDPSRRTTGRGLLLFAAIMLGLGLVLGVTQQAWQDAALWLAIAVFMACYGIIMLGVLQRLHRLLLIVGLLAGGTALWLALVTSLTSS